MQVRRLFDTDITHPWKRIFQDKLKPVGKIDLLLKCNFRVNSLPVQLSTFEKSLLNNWLEINSFSETDTHCLNQCIWNNHRILIGGKSIFYKEFADAGFKYIGQMFDRRGHLLNWQDITDSGVPQHSFLKWYGIVHSIPMEWKTNVNPNDFTALQRDDDEVNILFPGASYNLLEC